MTATAKRTVIRLELRPIAGSRFQPTGFPDLGAATFERSDHDGEQLLVESVQSMANHFEGTTWNTASNEPSDAVTALPYVRVETDSGDFLTSSRVEAHRLASAWILDSKYDGVPMREWLRTGLGLSSGRPLDPRAVATCVFALDPVSLLHGVFFAQQTWPWQPKIARAVTCFIEAANVRPAVSGGVKRDSVVNTSRDAGRGSKEGYGMVPHHRTEYTAESITLSCVVDEQQIRSYGLSETASEMLSALAEWEITTLLDGGLRLRTACDLIVAESSRADVPALDAASARLSAAIEASRSAGELGGTTVVVAEDRAVVPAKAGNGSS